MIKILLITISFLFADDSLLIDKYNECINVKKDHGKEREDCIKKYEFLYSKQDFVLKRNIKVYDFFLKNKSKGNFSDTLNMLLKWNIFLTNRIHENEDDYYQYYCFENIKDKDISTPTQVLKRNCDKRIPSFDLVLRHQLNPMNKDVLLEHICYNNDLAPRKECANPNWINAYKYIDKNKDVKYSEELIEEILKI